MLLSNCIHVELCYSMNICVLPAKPYFVMPLQDQHLDTGTRQLTWRCEARAVPFPVYSWYKDGVPITNNSNGDISVHSNTLYLRNIEKKRDSGMYQCFAANSHGVTTTAAQLRVLGKTVFNMTNDSSSIAAEIRLF